MPDKFRKHETYVRGCMSLDSLANEERARLLDWVRKEYPPQEVYEEELGEWVEAHGYRKEVIDGA